MSRFRIIIFFALLTLFTLPMFAQDDEPAGDKTLPGENDTVIETSNPEDTDNDDDDDDESVSNTEDDDFAEMLEQGDVEITVDDILLDIDFSDDDDWENYEEDTRFVEVDDGEYVAEVEGNSFIWGQNDEIFDDVVIQVTARQDGGDDDNGFGVICRTDDDINTFDGYHFLIDGLGNAAIFRYEEGDGYIALANWEEDNAINIDDEPNILHIVCVDEYLALYVNGELVVEAEDDEYDEGVVSLVIVNFDDDTFARAIFDDLIVYEADD